ncbi:RimK family alpha-L-glutamate ligase [Plantactinospora sp. GCM10030261]|uniref:ATP-grasp domain-containing protein n=1 Tax=Plantactinospora sp. GCM10030261 TaxID=3273420 RepID=UPI003623F218
MSPPASTGRSRDGSDPGPVYLVTSADQPELGTDDRLLHQALLAAGVPVTVAVWTDPDVPWHDAAVCVIRSVWDYHLHPERFIRWLSQVSTVTTVLNPPRLVAWNTHKRYLIGLAAAGIPTVETVWITPGSNADVRQLLDDTGWEQALLKPAVSASAWLTGKVRPGDAEGQRLLGRILRHCDAMLQPYLATVDRDGEVSVIVIDGAVSHGVRRKSALTGDIEVTRHGSPHEITPAERSLAERIVGLLPEQPLYARVDLLRDDADRLLLGELELVEPVLYLRHARRALDGLATAVRRHACHRTGASAPTPRPGAPLGAPA